MLSALGYPVHRWFSGRMLACHAGGPGSIPGRCKFLELIHIYYQQQVQGVVQFNRYYNMKGIITSTVWKIR